jgi:hypothetical protein
LIESVGYASGHAPIAKLATNMQLSHPSSFNIVPYSIRSPYYEIKDQQNHLEIRDAGLEEKTKLA